MDHRPGIFITLEGPEGAGKSFQVRQLVARLQAAGRETLATREPGGTAVGDQLREVLLTPGPAAIGPRTQALILCAARAQLVDDVIKPALERQVVVVCDRYADSTLAYQGFGHGVNLRLLRETLHFATGGLWPDLTLLLDVPVQIGLQRKAAQQAGSPEAWNRFEAETLAFHERVRGGYHALAAEAPERWRTLDGRLPADVLAEQTWRLVADHLARAFA